MKIKQFSSKTYFAFFCPGCEEPHTFTAHTKNGWEFNDDLEKPTLSPSYLLRGTEPITDDEANRILAGEKIPPRPSVCHSFIKNGRIEFLSDCTHKLKSQTVDLPDYPEKWL